MRFAHYMRPNQNNEIPSQFICVDTETKPTKHNDGSETDRLWFGWACYQRSRGKGVWCEPEWIRFEDRETFWRWVLEKARPKTTLYIFCHNTNFDLPVLGAFTTTRKIGLKLKMAIIDAPPTILKWSTGKATIKCLDTLNLWRMPLKMLGEIVGAKKLDMPASEDSREKWEAYGRQDVEVLRRALIDWWAFLVKEDLGNFRPTLASQALGTFKHRFMQHKILIHNHEKVLALERASYHGGRCECFAIGKFRGRFTLLDVTSMYPFVMHQYDYPAKFLFSISRPWRANLDILLSMHCLVADVTLETDEPAFPLVHGGKLVFPIGRFRTTLTTGELDYANRKGYIHERHAIAVYNRVSLFRGFVDHFWNHRMRALQAGQASLAWQYKILMNSLYGKFGQNGRVWDKLTYTDDEGCDAWAEIDADAGTIKRFRKLAGLVQSFSEAPESAESCPAIAAHVTANARMILWGLVRSAGSGHVYYCDTDSLLVDRVGLSRLRPQIGDSALGKLKVEGRYQDIEIWGPKDYRFGDKIRHKGIRANAEQIDERTFLQWQWSSLRGMLRSGQMDAPGRKPIVKHLSRVYDKGIIDSTRRVRPLVMNEPASDDT